VYYGKVWNYLEHSFDQELKIQQQSHGRDLLVQLAFKLTYSLQVTSQHFDRTNETLVTKVPKCKIIMWELRGRSRIISRQSPYSKSKNGQCLENNLKRKLHLNKINCVIQKILTRTINYQVVMSQENASFSHHEFLNT
jgi:hypothetical protein